LDEAVRGIGGSAFYNKSLSWIAYHRPEFIRRKNRTPTRQETAGPMP